MTLFVHFNYMIEILLAELVFLRAYPRRRIFPLRLALAASVSLLAGAAEYAARPHDMAWIAFLSMLLVLATTTTGMYFTFQASFGSVLSACASGMALQHIGHHVSRLISLLPLGVVAWSPLMEFTACMTLDTAAFMLLAGSMKKTQYPEHHAPAITAISLIIVFLCTGVTRFLRLGGTLNLYATICTSLYAIVCCSLSLFIQFFLYYFIQFRSEYLLFQRIQEEERSQYETSRENFELLNIKCHDLKHKLLSLENRLPKAELDSMRDIIDSYDSTYHTGLDVLDIILNEKSLRCKNRSITLTYMGPGEELGFMDVMDAYSLFGNILDNAITAADKFQIPEKRLVSMVVERRGSFVMISTINYVDDMHALSFADGLPRTTKEGEAGYHGYGLKSVRTIAEKYSGGVTITAAEGIFHLSVYLMSE